MSASRKAPAMAEARDREDLRQSRRYPPRHPELRPQERQDDASRPSCSAASHGARGQAEQSVVQRGSVSRAGGRDFRARGKDRSDVAAAQCGGDGARHRKQIACAELGTLYRALSAEASTAYGLSPIFIVHDELGQVRGPSSELYEALETSVGAQEQPLVAHHLDAGA
jgi:hypothetical protein